MTSKKVAGAFSKQEEREVNRALAEAREALCSAEKALVPAQIHPDKAHQNLAVEALGRVSGSMRDLLGY